MSRVTSTLTCTSVRWPAKILRGCERSVVHNRAVRSCDAETKYWPKGEYWRGSEGVGVGVRDKGSD